MLKRGDVVVIFQDPVTCKKPEGDAILKQFLSRNGDLEQWMVRFRGEPGQFERNIDAANIFPA